MFIQSTSLSSRISKNIFLIHLRNTFPNMNALFLPVDSYFHMHVFSREPVTIYICKIHVRRISGCPSMWSQRWYYLSKLVQQYTKYKYLASHICKLIYNILKTIIRALRKILTYIRQYDIWGPKISFKSVIVIDILVLESHF